MGEVARLKELYGLKDNEAIAKELGRPVSSVRRMAKTLYPGATHSGEWTTDEVQNLKRYIGVASEDVIARILGRTVADVKAQISDLGRVHSDTEWTQADIAELKRLYGTRTDETIAHIFGRTTLAVAAKASELCLAKDKAFVRKLSGKATTRMPRWSSEEIEKLKELYGEYSNLEIAQMLDRSVKSVVSKAHNLGLRKDRSRLAEMGRQNVSLRYGRREDGTKDPNVEDPKHKSDAAGAKSSEQSQATAPEQQDAPPKAEGESEA